MTMRKSSRAGVVGLAACALAATAFTGPAQASPGTAAAAGDHRATQRAMDEAVRAGVPGITAQVRDANGIWKSASGVGNLRTGAPRGKNDRFRVGNITNTFVATVLLQMEAEKKLSLDDTVEQHLPGLVRGNGNDGREITVRQLLNHTSGLFDFAGDKEFAATYFEGDGYLKHRYDTVSPEKRIKVALSHEPAFKPGAMHTFSNTNDVLAALIIEKVGGRSYEKEVRKRIIKPLKLKATSNPGNRTRLPRPSGRGYSKLFKAQPDRIDDVTEVNGSQAWGNSDIISSAGDLNRFYGALLRGKLLPPKQLKEMKTTVDNPYFPGASYGLGIEKYTLSCGTTLWYHDGIMPGWTTFVATTEDGHQLTFNYNSDWGAETLFPVLNAEYCGAPSRAH
ncbi:serine hydrolase domain-containing protein [Streptomyces sp. NPDC059063]|uniref:serine hydrolase domain-containing protein n=1 Tax=unclassified Streptomyces TaxID=2593676 RepID=UPI0036D1FCBD